MITFREFLETTIVPDGEPRKSLVENPDATTGGGTLTVFDIDDTLFRTSARVGIRRNGVTTFLDPQQYNDYKREPGDEIDYAEFMSSKIFHDTSEPIDEVLERAKQIIHGHGPNDKTIICTARQDFDDKELFLQTFRKHGLDVDQMYVERSGNLALGSSAKNKRFVFHKYLRSGKFDRCLFFDDALPNLIMFKALAKQYRGIAFEAYHVDHGKIKRY